MFQFIVTPVSNDSLASPSSAYNGSVNDMADEDSLDGAPTHRDAIILQIPDHGFMSDGDTSCDDTMTQNSITKLLSTKLKVSSVVIVSSAAHVKLIKTMRKQNYR